MLHVLGLDHKRLAILDNGRNYRLTDSAGNVLISSDDADGLIADVGAAIELLQAQLLVVS